MAQDLQTQNLKTQVRVLLPGTVSLFERDSGGSRYVFFGAAEHELMRPRSLTKRLVNHVRPVDVTEGYAVDRTVGQLRGPAQRVAGPVDGLK